MGFVMNQTNEPSMVKKNGNINKCPSCGAQVGAFVSLCESCGHEFSEITANKTITALVAKFDEIEREADDKKLMTSGRREKMIFSKRARVIRDFPIPNSREDLQQLLYFIQPKLLDGLKPDPNIEDWRAKFNEVLNRAKNAYKNDSAALAEFTQIENSIHASLSESMVIKAKRNPLFVALLAGLIILGIITLVGAQIERSKKQQCEEKYSQNAQSEQVRLEESFKNTEQSFKNKQYSEALASAAKLQWELIDSACKIEDNQKARILWENKRKQFEAVIQNESQAITVANEAEANRILAEKQAEVDKIAASAKVEADKILAQEKADADKARAKAAQAHRIEIEKKW